MQAIDKLVYDNHLGTTPLELSPGEVYADDIYTTAGEGCPLASYEFELLAPQPATLDVALYDSCPISGGQMIAGTNRQIAIPFSEPQWVTVAIPPDVEIELPNAFWIGFTTSASISLMGGAPALMGYSSEIFGDPQRGCSAFNGTYPVFPHASFNVRVHVREPCGEAFFGYRLSAPLVGSFSPGQAVRWADDLRLIVPSCQLLGFETAFRSAGLFEMDLRRSNTAAPHLPGAIIPGTYVTFLSSGGSRTFRHVLPEPVNVPGELWFTVKSDGPSSRTILGTRPPRAGETNATFAVETGSAWQLQTFENELVHAGMQISLWCAGTPPIGACCDMYFTDEKGDGVCCEVPAINCPFPGVGFDLLPQWQQGQTCDSSPFEHPCGAAACCRSDGTCENRLSSQCIAGSVSWHRGIYCDDPEIDCEFVCLVNEESCTLPHNTVGCADAFCCRDVCQSGEVGAYCCNVEWDSLCVQIAAEVCSIPPANDECAGVPRTPIIGALLVDVPSSTPSDGLHATENESDPSYCCHSETPDGIALGTVWYKFIAPGDAVELNTCASNAPAQDSLVQVFAVGNDANDQVACASLRPISCGDDAQTCSDTQANTRMCVTGLAAGEMYYVMLGAKTPETKAVYTLQIEAGCTPTPADACECPMGTVSYIDPPAGFVDPRRPVNPTAPQLSQTTKTMRVLAPVGSERLACWNFCGRADDGLSNEIAAFVAQPDGTTLIELRRPAAHLSEMLLGYADENGVVNVRFITHPGDVDGNGVANIADVAHMKDVLRFGPPDAEFPERFDIDRSGQRTPLDLLEVIDLLSGAGTHQVWNQTQWNPGTQCP